VASQALQPTLQLTQIKSRRGLADRITDGIIILIMILLALMVLFPFYNMLLNSGKYEDIISTLSIFYRRPV
jgi:ABC-type glycerol-3-phosphate transport system permease component